MVEKDTGVNWKARALAAEAQLDALGFISQASEAAKDVLAMADWTRMAIGTTEFSNRGLATLQALRMLSDYEKGKIRHAISLRLNLAIVELQVGEQKLRSSPAYQIRAAKAMKDWQAYKKRTEND